MAEGGVSLKNGAYAAHNCGAREQHKDTGQKLAEAPTGLDAIVAAAAAEMGFGASSPNSPPASSSEECTSGRGKVPSRGVGKTQAGGRSGDLARPSTDSTELRQQEHDDHSGEGGARGSGGTERGSDKDTITNAADEDRADCARTATGTAATATVGGRHMANASEPASAPAPSVDGKHSRKLARPEKNEPCPRCSSDQTKFCYYNNYNPNQPRFYCKGCQRYWTAGGTLRNVPPGSGRRKSKAHPKEHAEVAHNFDTVMNQGSNFPMPANMAAQPYGLAGQDANAAAQLFAYQQQAAMLGGSPLAMQLPGMGGLTGGQWMSGMGELPGSSHYANALQGGFLGSPGALMGGSNMLQALQQPTGTLAAAGGKDSLRGPSSQAGASRGAVRTHDSNGDNCRNVRARTDSGFSQGTGTGTGVCAEGEGSSPKLLAATQKHQDMSASSAKRGSPTSAPEMGPGLPMQDLLAQQQLMHAAWLRQATGSNGGWHGLGLLGGGLNMVSQQSAIAALAAQQQPQPGMGFPGGGVSQLGMGLNPYMSQGVFNGGMPGNLMALGNPQSQLMAPQAMAQQLLAACSQPGGMMQGGWGTQAAQLHGLADCASGLAGAAGGPALSGTAALMAAAASTMGNNNTTMLGSGLEGMGDGGAGRGW